MSFAIGDRYLPLVRKMYARSLPELVNFGQEWASTEARKRLSPGGLVVGLPAGDVRIP